MNKLREFIFISINSLVFLYLYTEALFYYGNDLYIFTPEYIYIYLLVSIFIYNFFKKMTSLDCLVSYIIIFYLLIHQYLKVLEVNHYVNNDLWYNDTITIHIKIILLICILIIFLFMYILQNKNSEIFLNFENFSLILLCLAGIFIFLNSNHLFVLYLGIELQSLSLYILCCLKQYSNKSLEAGLKYFIYGSFSSLILLFGVSLIYFLFGCLNLNDINLLIITIINEDNIILHIGLICILIGFLFKLAVFPFHWWLADIYEGSSDIITFFLAAIPKLPFFYILYRLYILLFSNFILYSYILVICGLLSILVGTILALYVIKIKKLLAYSSIVHMGYMIIVLSSGSKIGIAIAFYYFLIYIFTTINIFTIFLAIKTSYVYLFGNVTDFVYLKNSNKLLALITIVSLLSLAGIPPFMGFYGKLYIFDILISTGYYYICLILVLLSILSCVYYIRLIRFIFFNDKFDEQIGFQRKQSSYIYMFIAFCFFINIIFLFFQEPLLIYIIFLFF